MVHKVLEFNVFRNKTVVWTIKLFNFLQPISTWQSPCTKQDTNNSQETQMHNIKRYQTTQKQTHKGCISYAIHTAHNLLNVAHYHCSKDLRATLLDFPNHHFFLAAKLHEAAQIWCFCPAVRLVSFVVGFSQRSTA